MVPGDPQRFLDDEGTVYLEVTTTNAAFGATLDADLVRLKVR